MAKDKKRGLFSWLGFNRSEEESKQDDELQQDTEQHDPQNVDAANPSDDSSITTDEINYSDELKQASSSEVTPDLDLSQTAESDAKPLVYDDALTPLVEPQEEQFQVTDESVSEVPFTATDDEVEQAHRANTAEEFEDTDIVDEPELSHAELDEEIEQALLAESDRIDSEDPEQILEQLEEEEQLQQEQERPTKEGFFARLKRSLLKTKQNLGSGFISLFRGKRIDDELFEELEEQLLIADVGVTTTSKIINSLTEHASHRDLKDAEALYGKLKEEMADILKNVEQPLDVTAHKPFVILMVGVNGVGKTTTIGKLARQFQDQGKSVMLAAGDTFRAAAVEQLQVWGTRNKIPVVAQHTGADSASVIFDAIQAAQSRGVDVLIADTAGRLQNKSHLMEELKKIVRVMKKLDENAPHEIMLTIDASTGQNAISQTKLFDEAIGLTGITLTKLDGTAKGGVIFSVADQFGIPIRYIGVGEGIEDLRPFQANDFIEALFARED
ncbi:signal recognition particle-docking protein FtsY [Budviciaceae bacterium BWR-B9]|uniref:Signal recognition particle receptor FtsY n=1 Tax=Limnobaculum allomyrinae TaxID=2791986 RepID=A0ABS1IR53_9GAMM|nr:MULTISPECIES: signal recognition particle-docking protein FtsY [Limnobaculum]MBK5144042.1 signal recognition particle-docking protein FtsY [Limnobaculum allomyrinae]MBV7691701.1 signal recognition particle-docking protein FtsY [Limnobaculum sp. M2-1]